MTTSSRSQLLLIPLVGIGILFSEFRASAQRILDPQMFAGMRIVGNVGTTQFVQAASSLSSTASWTTLTNFVLTSTSQFFLDLSSTNVGQRFYRSGPAAGLGFYAVTLKNINDTATNATPRGTNRSIVYSPGRMGRLTNQFTVPTASIYATADLYFDVPYSGDGAGAYIFLGDASGGSVEIASVVSSTHLVVRRHNGTAAPGAVFPAGTNVRRDGTPPETVATTLINTFRPPAKGATISDVFVNPLDAGYLYAYVYIDGYAYQIMALGVVGPPPSAGL